MKKALCIILLMFLWVSTAQAAWTITPSIVSKSGHYLTWKIVCTSDGDALSATDVVVLMSDAMKRLVQGSTLMVMTVVPGTSSVAPDTTINVTLGNSLGITIFSATGYSYTANTTGISLAQDFTQYPTVHDKFYLTINDIGSSGDQVTLYFECWLEDK